MFTATQIVGLKGKGLSMAEIGKVTGKVDYEQLNSLLDSQDMKKEEVLEYILNLNVQQVSSKRGQKAPEKNTDVKVLHTSASVIQSEVKFGGIPAEISEWKGKPVLKNRGTGAGVSNGLFVVLTKMDEGKINPIDTYAQLELVKRLFQQHIEAIGAMQEWAREKASELGVNIPTEE